jgi:uncharacterized protein
MKNVSLFSHVVLQPTTVCNLNCRYCYLPDRDKVEVMTREITEAIAKSVETLNCQICLVWHGGEPLATGIKTLRELVEPFRNLRVQQKIRHSIQTNGTLISQQWCDFFREENFQIGISLDGNEFQNSERVTITGIAAFPKIMNGIKLLKQNNLPFSILATVNPKNIETPRSFYEFFSLLGCSSLNINVEEREGFNQRSRGLQKKKVKHFWQGLFKAWKRNPVIKIREIDMALGYISSLLSCADKGEQKKHYARGFWPTIASNGDMVVISPEFVSIDESERQRFVIGNILETPLYKLVYQSQEVWYVKEFFIGVDNCRRSCEYYEFCGGGQASNKYFELGNITETETAHCRNTRKIVMDVVLESLS